MWKMKLLPVSADSSASAVSFLPPAACSVASSRAKMAMLEPVMRPWAVRGPRGRGRPQKEAVGGSTRGGRAYRRGTAVSAPRNAVGGWANDRWVAGWEVGQTAQMRRTRRCPTSSPCSSKSTAQNLTKLRMSRHQESDYLDIKSCVL